MAALSSSATIYFCAILAAGSEALPWQRKAVALTLALHGPAPEFSELPEIAQPSNETTGQPWLSAVLRPIRSFRLAYLPLILIYFAYGALGLIDVSRDMWVKEQLTLSPAELAGIGVWLSLPWTVKMVFGELVDSVPIFGSQRKAYVLIGAAATASGMLTLAGAAGGWIAFARVDQLYVLGAMLIVIGTVIQDVVADAMSTEVVARRDGAGKRARRRRCAPNSAWCR